MMKTIAYTGPEEIKQITHHSLRAKGTLRIYEMVYASLNRLFSDEDAAKVRQQFVKNKIKVHELTNAPYRDQEIAISGFDELVEARCLDPKRVAYETEIIIYNDVVAFYTYGEIAHGLEIYDEKFARTQAQIFDQLWQKASRPIIGPGGRTSLI